MATNWASFWNLLWLDDGSRPRFLLPHYEKGKAESVVPTRPTAAWAQAMDWGKARGYVFSLRSVSSVDAIDPSGRAVGWEFDVDVLSHRASGTVRVMRGNIHFHAKPQPGPGSDVFELVGRGFLPTVYLQHAWDDYCKQQRVIAPHQSIDLPSNLLSAWSWELAQRSCRAKLSFGFDPQVQSAHDMNYLDDQEAWYWFLDCGQEKKIIQSSRAW